jgi:ABC-type uncharacterized transport system substrate-binding protein
VAGPERFRNSHVFTFWPQWPIMQHGGFAQRNLDMKTFHVTALAVMAMATSALAHPHVFVEMRSDIAVREDGQVKGIDVEWAFDDAYAQVALEGMDANGDGAYSSEELAELTRENLDSLKDYDYFVTIRQGGRKLERGSIGLSSQTYIDGKLRLYFQLLLKTPADPKAGEIEFKIYDPEFFIAFDYVKSEPVTLDGSLSPGCALAVKPLPTNAEVDKTREFLADKAVDWKPDQQEDFGAMFAQPVVVSCKS